jgi:hypothetical protein
MNARLVATVTLLAVTLAGCAARISVGEPGDVIVREADEEEYTDRYGSLGSAVLSVVADGRTYQVTMGARAQVVLGVDSDGGYHEPRERGCVDDPSRPFTICRVFEVPPGTTLVGFVLRDVYWPVN